MWTRAWLGWRADAVVRRLEEPPSDIEEVVESYLSEGERRMWEDFPVDGPRRREWLAGRIAAKEAVAVRLGLSAPDFREIEVLPNPRGRPVVRLASGEGPCVSIAHTRTRAAAAAAETPVGFDFEDAARAVDFLLRAFSEEEREALASVGAPVAGEAVAGGAGLLPYWCAKEAAAKAAGTGLGGFGRGWLVAPGGEVDEVVVTRGEERFVVELQRTEAGPAALCVRRSRPCARITTKTDSTRRSPTRARGSCP